VEGIFADLGRRERRHQRQKIRLKRVKRLVKRQTEAELSELAETNTPTGTKLRRLQHGTTGTNYKNMVQDHRFLDNNIIVLRMHSLMLHVALNV
jgi:hypothetical protein